MSQIHSVLEGTAHSPLHRVSCPLTIHLLNSVLLPVRVFELPPPHPFPPPTLIPEEGDGAHQRLLHQARARIVRETPARSAMAWGQGSFGMEDRSG